MPHLPENNPLAQISREVRNIRFLLRRGETESISTRLDYLVLALQRLATEQATLKAAFKQKAREANLMKLRCIHWREQYERSETARRMLERRISDEMASHHATMAELGNTRAALRRLEGGSHA